MIKEFKIKTAEYLSSGVEEKQFPAATLPEYCVIGRSNVGKSSLINMLTNNSKLAKVSKTPGKTITINHFIMDGNWYLADLPGYGYAKRSQTTREQWEKMTEKYFTTRKNLFCVWQLIDSRIPPQRLDLEFSNKLGTLGVPFILVFTKCDKQSSLQSTRAAQAYHNEMKKTWEEVPEYILTSSVEKIGKSNLLQWVETTNKSIDMSEIGQ
jgi:GTP-binding protein